MKKIIFGWFFVFSPAPPWKYIFSSCTDCTLSSQRMTLEQLLCLGWSLLLCKHNFIGQIENPISNYHLHYFLQRHQCTQYSWLCSTWLGQWCPALAGKGMAALARLPEHSWNEVVCSVCVCVSEEGKERTPGNS